MILLLLGPPGAGKGTQGDLLAERLGVPKIATGDVLRLAVRERTPMGLAARAAMDRGDLVPDEVILGIMKEALAAPSAARGAVLDGVVRTVPQAEGLARVVAELRKSVDGVLLFDVPDEQIVARLSGRTICENCQTPYSGRAPGTSCDKCGGTLVRRPDDEPESVRNRLANYHRQTAPVIAWYLERENGGRPGPRFMRIDAVGTLEQVLRRAEQALEAGLDG
ncbi:MAG: adenylate kinase family protein [Gemmatimonadota bacterium]